jgi:hypothetical protein
VFSLIPSLSAAAPGKNASSSSAAATGNASARAQQVDHNPRMWKITLDEPNFVTLATFYGNRREVQVASLESITPGA